MASWATLATLFYLPMHVLMSEILLFIVDCLVRFFVVRLRYGTIVASASLSWPNESFVPDFSTHVHTHAARQRPLLIQLSATFFL
jgi:hypothetical protein